ncbi:DUF1624 domain-containing protein [Corticibacter populi]|uniref:DUF1624 domain-containing protein n=1 Tax=Corticibacter populi TaxID=1550736 RepID=A0A3M6QR02_9BURK|nr:heparan-alpha-glucosaminide N-acetyltransferase domain-containing protein [Corticibacter populi]RMX04832.1 DUF1624 domain-containing protein [Corticibacter populi]RZS33749.1 putative membrane protein [Corticibacter populi]
MSTSTATAPLQAPSSIAAARSRLQSIDALRGFVIVLMLLDHVRETFYLHAQVSDPMDVTATPPELFFSRLLAHLCAPVFVFLTGLSAWLYAQKHAGDGGDGRAAASAFLFKRGLFLVLLELTLVNFAWTFQFPPSVVYLQVIWAIGLSMLALAALVWLPRPALALLGLALVAGHNLLDGLHFPAGHALHVPWAILHDRGWLEAAQGLRLRTSYPVLPWIGVIALGYAAGPWFGRGTDAAKRQRLLLASGLGALVLFLVLRAINGYGDKPWVATDSLLANVMGFVNITKYPPSLLFLALTLGLGLLLLRWLERCQQAHGGQLPPALAWLMAFGAAPMFFYLLHLYVLKLLYLAAVAIWGTNQGQYFGFDGIWAVWLCTIVLAAALYWPVKAFAGFKARRRDIAWLKYL